MSNWRPMETAPRDGTWILICVDGLRVEIVAWNDDRYAMRPRPYFSTYGSVTRDRKMKIFGWMPLPKALKKPVKP